jgi:ATP-dependent Clp protease ATP-binding subunit ClpC
VSDISKGASAAWQIAAAETVRSGHQQIQKVHLLIGILSLEKLDEAPEWSSLGPWTRRAAELRRALRERLGRGDFVHDGRPVSRSPEVKAVFHRAKEIGNGSITAGTLLSALLENPDPEITAVLGGTPTFDRYGRDLTALARAGELGPVIGRRRELLELLQTLARSTKNNPILVGEAGVGKTAIVEALALRGAAGKDELVLGGKRIVELQLATLLGGTKYRGEFEKRLTAILDEVRAHPELIVFVDEIHNLAGAGAAGDQAMDAANILKPALSRGDFCCIGATTPAEYRKHIESDPALARRFEKVVVNEPSREETLEILRGLRPRWEEHHGVAIGDAALEAAVELSLRFDTERRLPDKAIDLVDKAAARTRVPVLSMMAPEKDAPAPARAEVDEASIAAVVGERFSLPPEPGPRLLGLESFLKGRLFGQDEPISKVARRLRLAYSGMKTREGPMGVFLLLGPTGVGKTELARLLAEFCFGGAKEMCRLDMSEYMEEHSVSKLVGAPPGYVGYEDEGRLSAHLARKPHSLILLDEVEKAHPRVLDLFLQMFDEGRLTDSQGRSLDARHSVFVMTSNLGTSAGPQVGFSSKEVERNAALLEGARSWFRPELWNRIDEVIVFDRLGPDEVKRILGARLREIRETLLREHDVGLEVSPEVERFLAEEGFSAALGARELQRVVERLVQVPLAQLILSGKIRSEPSWKLVYDEGGVYLLPGGSGGNDGPRL